MPPAKTIKVRRRPRGPHDNKSLLKKKKKERRAQLEERRQQALLLRQGGATYDEIARTLNLSNRAHAKRLVDQALSSVVIEAAKDVVRMDLLRLDEFIMRCTHDLRQNGNLHQIDRLMRIMEFRYRLLGINGEDIASLRQEHGITHVTHNKNVVMMVQASPETEDEFIQKMMGAVGVDPDSPQAQKYLKENKIKRTGKLPMLKGSANERMHVDSEQLGDEEILDALDEVEQPVDAEIVEE